jgi:peroxiredoxin
MARTSSAMLSLGTPAPDFRLPDFAGRTHSLADFAYGRALLVVFICGIARSCGFARQFARYAVYRAKGLAVVAKTRMTSRPIREMDPTACAPKAAEAALRLPVSPR